MRGRPPGQTDDAWGAMFERCLSAFKSETAVMTEFSGS